MVRALEHLTPSGVYPVGGNAEGDVPIRVQTLCPRASGLCGGLWDHAMDQAPVTRRPNAALRGADVVVIDGQGGLPTRRLVWLLGMAHGKAKGGVWLVTGAWSVA